MTLRQPLIPRKPRGLQGSRTQSLPAPIGGWNARDPEARMQPTEALILENWFPRPATVDVRPGAQDWVTGFASPVRTLMTWAGTSSSKLFAATDSGIYDATAQGTVGAAVNTITNGYLQYTNITTVGGSFLVAVNGVDKLRLYDGTTWKAIDNASTPAITGLATTSLVDTHVFKTRLWFVQKDSLSAWYLPAGQIAGALTELPLGQIFTRGGYLMAINTWTLDGGNGSDDYLVFASSEGEIAVYKGTDPASASTFALVGCYYIGEPLGRRCMTKYGGDLLTVSQNGLLPLSKALQTASIDRRQALTAKIDQAFTDAAGLYVDNIGWQAIAFPQGSFVLVNIPVTNTGYFEQYVMNSISGAWCKFSGWNAYCWETYEKDLFFGGGNKVAKVWTGNSDFGANIVCVAQQAYSYFGSVGRIKQWKLARPVLKVSNDVQIGVSLAVDFQSEDPSISQLFAFRAGDKFDTAIWDSAVWGSGLESVKEWHTVFAKDGYAAGLRLQLASNTATVSWSATDFVYELGGVL